MKIADFANGSCKAEALSDRRLAKGNCLNLRDRAEADQCAADAADERRDAFDECKERRKARRQVCRALGERRYDPQLDPADFTHVVDNPYFPLKVGSSWTYNAQTEDGFEEVVVEVDGRTKDIDGIECIVVRDRVWLDGVLVEDTDDYFAQDLAGNVWYMGEISKNYETATWSTWTAPGGPVRTTTRPGSSCSPTRRWATSTARSSRCERPRTWARWSRWGPAKPCPPAASRTCS